MANRKRRRPKRSDPVVALVQRATRKSRVRKELMSVICEALKHGDTAKQMLQWLEDNYSEYGRFTREDCWRLIRQAAQHDWLVYEAPPEDDLQEALARRYSWKADRLTVVHTAVLDQMARVAAVRLLELVRVQQQRAADKSRPIRVGFAGGRSLRQVARHFARLLAGNQQEDLPKIVFHAMVSAFGDSDFLADPNSFITYFVQEKQKLDIAFAPMPAPGIVESHLRSRMREFKMIREAFEAAQELDIIVTSGGRLDDEHSTLSEYLGRAYDDEKQAEMRQMLKERDVVGDLLWQPLTADGPLDMQEHGFEFCPNPLVELSQLPDLIEQKGVRVLLVLGACGACREPKGELFDAILRQGAPGLGSAGTRPLVTDIVSDSRNAFQLLRQLFPPQASGGPPGGGSAGPDGSPAEEPGGPSGAAGPNGASGRRQATEPRGAAGGNGATGPSQAPKRPTTSAAKTKKQPKNKPR